MKAKLLVVYFSLIIHQELQDEKLFKFAFTTTSKHLSVKRPAGLQGFYGYEFLGSS